jgi:hypothetical protein
VCHGDQDLLVVILLVHSHLVATMVAYVGGEPLEQADCGPYQNKFAPLLMPSVPSYHGYVLTGRCVEEKKYNLIQSLSFVA